MNFTISLILSATFLASVLGLFMLVWAIATDSFGIGVKGAKQIFEEGEEGRVDDPSISKANAQAHKEELADEHKSMLERERIDQEILERVDADRSTSLPVLLCLCASVVWLMVGSVLGVIVSLKMHYPDWLNDTAGLTFGILRPMHLNAVIYGWVSSIGIGLAIWLVPRLFKCTLQLPGLALLGAVLWNIGVAAGLYELYSGRTTGIEWLEFPWYVDVFLVVSGSFVGASLFTTILTKPSKHLYVSVWYLVAAFIWFPIIFIVANIPGLFKGVDQSIVNWWFAHNALGLWLTPLALSVAYYLIPKIVGKPIYSYNLSLLGFWALALFYSQAGIHHLIGGPVPSWLVTLSIVQSVMMVIPVVAVAINHSMTLKGRFEVLIYSPSLRFVALGSFFYLCASLQGSLQALRSFNQISHFTHYTVAHAHLGVYGFVSMIMFGGAYYVFPRITGREWPFPILTSLHFWLVVIGFLIYFIGLTIGGFIQGVEMLDASIPFMQIVENTIPYLQTRSLGGIIMTLGHLCFAAHAIILMVDYKKGVAPNYMNKLRTLAQSHGK